MTATTAPRRAQDPRQATARIAKLNTASARKIIEPDQDVPGSLGHGQVIADELLSVAGLGLDLTAEQRATLSREEIASIAQAGIQFEAVLTAGFALQIVRSDDVTDPRITYLLHEIGEESRHSRLFVRLVEQLAPTARNPLAGRLPSALMRFGVGRFIRLPALLYTLVLGGEEIPDLMQKLASEHPATDPFLRDVNKYHRLEEARHLSFARTLLPEVWEAASAVDRVAVRYVAPLVIRGMFDTIVHPGVYETIGLDGWSTWRKVRRSPGRVAIRHEATRPVLQALVDAGIFRADRIPTGWRRLTGWS